MLVVEGGRERVGVEGLKREGTGLSEVVREEDHLCGMGQEI